MKKYVYICTAFACLIGASAQAQEKDKDKKDPIGTETVSVTSAYQASVNDAFKIKDNPLMNDEDNNQKKDIKYTIFSFPVASTFKPEKGQAADVDQDSLHHFYNNYALLSYGNYTTLKGELGIVEQINKNMYVGGLLQHLSSQGDITGVDLDNSYSKSTLDFTLGSKNTNNNWNVNAGALQSKYNWYGLPENIGFYTPADLYDLDVKHQFNDVHVGGKFESNIGPFESVETQYKYFWDNFDSKESHFFIRPKFNIELPNTTIHVNLMADYLNTTFGTNNLLNQLDKYSYFNLVAEPSVRFYNDDYSFELGAGIGYVMGKANEESENRLLFYPKVTGHYDLVKDIVMFYAGAEGGIKQNTYADFSAENPYMAPGFELRPTHTQYDVYAGLKGKLYHNASYNVKVSYKSEDDKNIFVLNPYAANIQEKEGFHYGNSYAVLYDRVSTLTAFGEVNFDFNSRLSLGLSGEYNNYSASDLERVYNMPESRIGVKMHLDITDQWFAGFNVFFVGQRYERNVQNLINPQVHFDDYTLKSFTDLNAYVGYRPNAKWTAFVKGNNLFNESYMQWQNYKVQGLQVNAGVMYKFDL